MLIANEEFKAKISIILYGTLENFDRISVAILFRLLSKKTS